ncbi:hypothetical protein SAMN04488700_0151 [Carnobacterium iners]|uniref:Sel1 repeat-containing protein n=1 Tax=Carnobacterium iners TaxID=1073423 RepID=A0A1X7MP61_9LACT|nr:sel1 repeat family protein [Carnobacterium iners]SEK78474.1 hypothetical protein SAMN04488114_11154 [Carnobacterium iners]SMH26485.1 hypothetical protein SAMN04488700_0151 [Carnobacterium iners]
MIHLVIKKENDLIARTNLGKFYYKGLGVKQNYAKVFCLFQKVAELEGNEAIFWLERFYYQGLGVEKIGSKKLNGIKKRLISTKKRH